jgi:hypothetical protein
MLRLDQGQRTALSETLRELANLVVGALTLGQFVGAQAPSIWLILAGLALWLILIVWGLMLAGDKSDG